MTTIVFLSAIPGLVIAYAMFRVDKYEREPTGPLLWCFGLGGALTVPTMEVEKYLFGYLAPLGDGVVALFLTAFVGLALNEELFKFAALRVGTFPWRFFNEPLDGIVYGVMVAMGFATVENMFYAHRFGLETVFTRAFTAVPAHAVFAVVQGYFAGLAKFDPERRIRLLRRGLLFSIILHGTYDWLILQHWSRWLLVLGSCSLYLSIYYCSHLVRLHLDGSPFKTPPS